VPEWLGGHAAGEANRRADPASLFAIVEERRINSVTLRVEDRMERASTLASFSPPTAMSSRTCKFGAVAPADRQQV